MMSCKACDMAVQSAQSLIDLGMLPDEYQSDPEGASMYAYDHGWLCGGHFCLNEEADEGQSEFDRIVGPPHWVIALWREEKDRDVFLPLAMSWDYWPVGGTFTQVGEQLDWSAERDDMFLIGGFYMSRSGPLTGLVCLDTKAGDNWSKFINPEFLTGTNVNLAEWGLGG